MQDLRWFRLDDESSVGAARRFASGIAGSLGYTESRSAEVAIGVTELATNVVRHGETGSMLVRLDDIGPRVCIEVVAVDSGPGFADPSVVLTDGFSTGGTLGVGLGAVRRLANRFEAHSIPERGTAVVATFCPDVTTPYPASAIDGITRPITGEEVCGDAWSVRHDPGRVILVLSDGLGHGELAARASRQIIECFAEEPWAGPGAFLEAAHRRASGTRGAAVLALDHETGSSTVRFAGIGNVAGRIVGGDKPLHISSQPGIVGHQMRRVREVELAVDSHSVVILHSDGLTQKWDASSMRGLLAQGPTVISAVLLREAGLRQDDASVIAMRPVP
ncbi:MAG: ATP-binding protein [Acidimicrobiales bacterium]